MNYTETKHIKEPILMILISVISYVISPSLFVITSLFAFIFYGNRNKIYSWFVIVSHGLLAYNWVPWNESFDLIRFHAQVESISTMSGSDIISNILTPFAPLSFLLKYFVYLMGDINLLQAIVTSLTIYFFLNIFQIYSKKNNLDIKSRAILFLVLYVTLPLLRVISGLWSMLSITYMSYIIIIYEEGRIKNKYLFWFLVYISTLIHFGSIIPIFLLFLLNFFDYHSIKKQFLSYLLVLLAMVLVFPVATMLYKWTGMSTFKFMASRFYAYVFNQDSFSYLNNYRFIIIEVSKTVMAFFGLYTFYKYNKQDEISNNSFYKSIYIGIFTVTFGLVTRILLRFTLMAVYLSVPFLSQTLKHKVLNKLEYAFIMCYITLNGAYLVYALYNAKLLWL